MKVRDCCKGFEAWPRDGKYLPSADKIVIESVRIEDDALSLRIRGETTDLLFQVLDKYILQRLCNVLRAHLVLDGPLSLRQLGEIDLDFETASADTCRAWILEHGSGPGVDALRNGPKMSKK